MLSIEAVPNGDTTAAVPKPRRRGGEALYHVGLPFDLVTGKAAAVKSTEA
jgi:hypothetical protein